MDSQLAIGMVFVNTELSSGMSLVSKSLTVTLLMNLRPGGMSDHHESQPKMDERHVTAIT
jgi:hypothetical protein